MPKNITASFRLFQNRYFIFIVAITITLLSGEFIMRQTLNKQNRDAELINVGGRQRMLSQRIAKRVLYSYIDIKETGTTPKEKLDTLSKLCTEFEAAHKNLLQECETNYSAAVMALLKTNTAYLNNIIIVCRHAAKNPVDSIFTEARKVLEHNELKFLLNQEEVVKLMVSESQSKVSTAKATGLALTIMTIIFLILEFVFIIIPLIKQLRVSNENLVRTSEELEKASEMLVQTGNVAKVGGWEIDLVTNKVTRSELTNEILEITPDFAFHPGKGLNFYKEGLSRETMTKALTNAKEQGIPFDEEVEIVTNKGNDRWVRVKGETEVVDGKCVRVYGIFQDIQALKEKDLLIEQSEELFRQTFNFSSIGIALVALDGAWIMVNKSLCNILGYSESELLQIKFQDITHPDDLEADLELVKKVIEQKAQSYQIEKRYFHKDGHTIWVLLTVSLVKDHYNKPLHFVSQIIDVSNAKKSEQIIKDERQLLLTLINNIPVNIFIKDEQSRKILVNKSEIEYMGLENENDILGKNDYELFPSESAAISIAEDKEVMDKNEPFFNRETTNFKHGSEEHYFLTSKIPLKNDENKITGILGISYDITDRKKSEQRLNDLVDVTTEQNTRLLNFAHIVSHNLRSHAGNFSMLLSFMEAEKDENEKLQMFNLLKKASANLTETVQHLNEVVEVTTTVTKEKEDVNLYDVIIKVQHNIQALIIREEVTIINNVDRTLHINAVPAYIDSIVLNFFTNAIKYRSTERPPVVKLSTAKDDKFIVLTIEDNGIGIDLKRNGDKLFGMYKTFHGNKDAKGVGLFITKNQVEAMGGKIEVESTFGEGTTFKIYFV